VVGTSPICHSAVSQFPFPDSPEVAPGAILSPSGASTNPTAKSTGTYPLSTSTGLPSPSPQPTHGSSNAGAIAGGVVGGVVAIAAAVLAIFFWMRRKRPQAPSAAFVVDGAPQPLMGEVRPPQSDDGTFVPPSMPGTPVTPMKLYVRVSMSSSQSVYVLMPALFSSMRRTRTTQLRSLGSKGHLRSRRSTVKYPTRRTLETRWPTCKLHGHRDITACPLSDLASSSVGLS
jgi:hypothetical protein